MSTTGLIFREARELEDLPQDWVPEALGSRSEVVAVVDRHLPKDDRSLALELRIEGPDESEQPRTISVSGVWGPRESKIINAICAELGARFYDASTGDFIEL